MGKPYEPSRSPVTIFRRKLTKLMNRRIVDIRLERPIVTFTFDDFPKSAITEGASRLDKRGWHGTFYVAAGLKGCTNHHGEHFEPEDLLALDKSGHEIAGHTFSHIDCAAESLDKVTSDITHNHAVLRQLGLQQELDNFAYPYGEKTPGVKQRLQQSFDTLRGVGGGVNRGKTDFNDLACMPAFSGADMSACIDALDTLSSRPGWLLFFTHDIRENPSPWGCTPAEFETLCDATENSGADVLTVRETVTLLETSI